MGLFDHLIKEVITSATDAIKPNLFKEINEPIPSTYNMFPSYPGDLVEKPKETATDKYTRLTLRYRGAPLQEYYDLLFRSGYTRGTDVRYDKDNTYIIVEEVGKDTKIAYHIKR